MEQEKIKELLNDVDNLLAHFEDFTHGKDGDDITLMRKRVIDAIKGVASTPPSETKEVAPTDETLESVMIAEMQHLSFNTEDQAGNQSVVIDLDDAIRIASLHGDKRATNREGWVKVEDGDRLVPMSEIESFIKVYNHEYHGKMWTIHSFLTGLNNWLKPKESKSK